MDAGHNLVDQRGRLLQRSYDVLGDSCFIVVHTISLELMTSLLHYTGYLKLSLRCRSIHNIHLSKARSRYCPSPHDPIVGRWNPQSRRAKFQNARHSKE